MLSLTRKTQILCYITIIVMALSVTLVLHMLAPACPVCGRKLCLSDHTGDTPGTEQKEGDLPGGLPASRTTRLGETARQEDSYLERICFAGDSRTVALTAYGVSADRVFAENGLNHVHALDSEVVSLNGSKPMTIPEAVRITQPDILLLNFGINGALYMGLEEFTEGYGRLVDTLMEQSPDSIVIIEAILPVAGFYETQPDGISNQKIDELNAGLYQLAQDKGVYYLAADEAMKGEDEKLRMESTPDGFHYNEAGSRAILDYVLTHPVP